MKKIENINILVVGDIMLDKYVVGSVDRISPEAPVQIVNVTEEYSELGGCGNVVRNIHELGANVDCLASVGHDTFGSSIIQKLVEINCGILLVHESEQTTVKERIIAEHRYVQMLRIDREVKKTINSKKLIEVLQSIESRIYDFIVVSDYAKGVISSPLMNQLMSYNTPIIVDPKPENAWMYTDVFMLTPNEKEWRHMQMSSKYITKSKYVLQTLGKKGMKLIEGNKELYIEAEPVDVYNVSGAGDTVVAAMAVCLSAGLDPQTSAELANKCAGFVVTQSGTSVVPKEKFNQILKQYGL